MDGNTGNLSVGDTKLTEFKFDYQWGGVDTPFTKMKRWAQKQKYPINYLAIGVISWLWVKWVDGKVQLEMADVDKQAEEIVEQWEEEEKKEPTVEIKDSDIEGLDEVRIQAPFLVDGDWNDISLNYKKWR